MELGLTIEPEIGDVPAGFPGSVQGALRRAGQLPDWNAGTDSRACEWVENRDWVFSATVPDEWCVPGARHRLKCHGLDGPGCVVLNGVEVVRFANAFVPHEVDFTDALLPSGNRIEFVFFPPPRWLGQVGYTSKMKDWKVRFNYGWDWIPRFVQIGPWEDADWQVSKGASLQDLRCHTDWDGDRRMATIRVRAAVDATPHDEELTVCLTLHDKAGSEVASRRCGLEDLAAGLEWELPGLRPWHPNGLGDQPLYTMACQLFCGGDACLDHVHRTVGFKCVEWLPCHGAPEQAPPWLCVVNGEKVFLQGVNWTPIRPNFADLTRENYERLLRSYAAMGCNLLRVWGGGFLEKSWFYELCDSLGLLVWQEFPLCSSALENWPHEDEASMGTLVEIARSYIGRRQHHASLLLWCGGNELQGHKDGGKVGIGRPVGADHPLMKRWAALVEQEDPGRRFVPTSAFGPTFLADAADFGQGIHWDVHGPWKDPGDTPEESRNYWRRDDALLRSEVGAAGASPAALIRRYAGGWNPLPADLGNELWRRCSWWLDWDAYMAETGGNVGNLESYVAWSQTRQAEGLARAIAASKSRFPEMGGVILWMGHDCFPCPINTSIFDFDGRPKPAVEVITTLWNMSVEEVPASDIYCRCLGPDPAAVTDVRP